MFYWKIEELENDLIICDLQYLGIKINILITNYFIKKKIFFGKIYLFIFWL